MVFINSGHPNIDHQQLVSDFLMWKDMGTNEWMCRWVNSSMGPTQGIMTISVLECGGERVFGSENGRRVFYSIGMTRLEISGLKKWSFYLDLLNSLTNTWIQPSAWKFLPLGGGGANDISDCRLHLQCLSSFTDWRKLDASEIRGEEFKHDLCGYRVWENSSTKGHLP